MSTTSNTSIAQAGQIYSPEERGTLERFFREVPPEGGVDPGSFTDALSGLSSEVARIALASIEERLPNWAAFRADGKYVPARSVSPPPDQQVLLAPRYLFTINWADSGPGFSWPEAYHAAYLPDFDRFVVTASQDSPDAYGVCDLAIGWFPGGQDLKAGVHRVITMWWGVARTSCEQGPWIDFFGAGSVFEQEAEAWRAEVWPDEDEPDEDESDEDESDEAETDLEVT